ncbi:hypothetical protein [Vescimonas sanitatis]|uniref:hypothetical protein n=1 Tax=Vescimonas sanitatis TaxID=3376993 RepID=UPI003B7DCCEF
MKRWFSGLLAAVMVLLLLPASASGTESFYAYLYSNPPAAVGETASVALFLGQNSTSREYNTYFFQIDYDAEKLIFASATIGSKDPDVIDHSVPGRLTIGGYGEPRSDRFITLNFTVKAAGEATVKLVKAQMDVRANAAKDAQTASVPAGQSNTVTILCGGFPVELPKCASGAAYVTANGDYTFTADPGYDYDFSATVDGKTVAIINNGDGSYTIENVTGELAISANSTPTVKTYAATVKGDGSGDVSAPTSATHGQEYTFTVTQAANYDYAVAVTVNGLPVTCTVNSSGSSVYTYTIPAKSVTGPVVITVKKAPQSGTTQIVLAGSGAADVWDGVTSYTVKSGEAFTFGINHQEGFDYTVTVMAGEKNITLQRNAESTSTYTIPGDCITGGIIMVTITKTAQLALTVDAAEYVKYTDGSVVWLITAAPKTKLPATKSLYYGDTAMFWSEKYEAYAWLLVGKGTAADIAAAAKSTISVKGNSTVSVSYSGDVNGTGHTDINDAQYVYDLYNAKHSALDMEKFLRCDVNGDCGVNVGDVRMVVSLLLR